MTMLRSREPLADVVVRVARAAGSRVRRAWRKAPNDCPEDPVRFELGPSAGVGAVLSQAPS